MTLPILLCGATLACAGLLLAARPLQDAPAGGDPMAAFADAAKYLRPNDNHAWLGQFLGEWDTTTRLSMMPGQPPLESRGKCTVRWLMEGRWLQSESEGSMMGLPVRSVSTLGYDNFKKKYVQSMVDSFQTCLLTAEGFRDQAGTALHLYGTLDEYLTGEHDKAVRYTLRLLSPDRYVLEVHDLAIGEANTKVVEVEYVRRK